MAPANIRAKFHCFHIDEPQAKRETHSGQTVKLRPVYGDAPENKSFASATPWGEVTMGISNPDVFGFFMVGQDYYLDFTPATVGSIASDLTQGDLDDEDEPVTRIDKAGDEPLPQSEVEVSPTVMREDVVEAVSAALPHHDDDHITAAVEGHMDEVAKATSVGQEPVNIDVHEAAAQAAEKAGATPQQAQTIAAAIPAAVSTLLAEASESVDARPVAVKSAAEELSTVVMQDGSYVQVGTSALVDGVKAEVPEALGSHIAAAVDAHHDEADEGNALDIASAAAETEAQAVGATQPMAEKIADAIPKVAASLPNLSPGAKAVQPESE